VTRRIGWMTGFGSPSTISASSVLRRGGPS
jgi:hypothetical protein